jgi:hypothetical protein
MTLSQGTEAKIDMAINFETMTSWSAGANGRFEVRDLSTGAFKGFLNNDGTSGGVREATGTELEGLKIQGDVKSGATRVWVFKGKDGKTDKVFMGIDGSGRVVLQGHVVNTVPQPDGSAIGVTFKIDMAMDFEKSLSWNVLANGRYEMRDLSTGAFKGFLNNDGTSGGVREATGTELEGLKIQGDVKSGATRVWVFKGNDGKTDEVFMGIDDAGRTVLRGHIEYVDLQGDGKVWGWTGKIDMALDYEKSLSWNMLANGRYEKRDLATGAFIAYLNSDGTSNGAREADPQEVTRCNVQGDVRSSAGRVWIFKDKTGKMDEAYMGIDRAGRTVLQGHYLGSKEKTDWAMNYDLDRQWKSLDGNGEHYISTQISTGAFVNFYFADGARVNMTERTVDGIRAFTATDVATGEVVGEKHDLDRAAVLAWANATGFEIGDGQFKGGIVTVFVDKKGVVRLAAGISDAYFIEEAAVAVARTSIWDTASVQALMERVVNRYKEACLVGEQEKMDHVQFFGFTFEKERRIRTGNLSVNASAYVKSDWMKHPFLAVTGLVTLGGRPTGPNFDVPYNIATGRPIKSTPSYRETRNDSNYFYGAEFFTTLTTDPVDGSLAQGQVAYAAQLDFANLSASLNGSTEATVKFDQWFDEVGSHPEASITYNATGRNDELSQLSGTASATFVDQYGVRRFQNAFLPLESKMDDKIARSNAEYKKAWTEYKSLTSGLGEVYGPGGTTDGTQYLGRFYADIIDYWTEGSMGQQLLAFKNGGKIATMDAYISGLYTAFNRDFKRMEEGRLVVDAITGTTSATGVLDGFINDPFPSTSVGNSGDLKTHLNSVFKTVFSSMSFENQETISVDKHAVRATVKYSFGVEAKDRTSAMTFVHPVTGETLRFGFDRSVPYAKVFGELDALWVQKGLTMEQVRDPVELAASRFHMEKNSVARIMGDYGLMKTGSVLNSEGYAVETWRCNEWVEISEEGPKEAQRMYDANGVNYHTTYETVYNKRSATVHAFNATAKGDGIEFKNDVQVVKMTYEMDRNVGYAIHNSEAEFAKYFSEHPDLMTQMDRLEGWGHLEITTGPGSGLEITKLANGNYQIGGELSGQFEVLKDNRDREFSNAGLRAYTDPETGQLTYGVYGSWDAPGTVSESTINLFTGRRDMQEINSYTGAVVSTQHLGVWEALSENAKIAVVGVSAIGLVFGGWVAYTLAGVVTAIGSSGLLYSATLLGAAGVFTAGVGLVDQWVVHGGTGTLFADALYRVGGTEITVAFAVWNVAGIVGAAGFFGTTIAWLNLVSFASYGADVGLRMNGYEGTLSQKIAHWTALVTTVTAMLLSLGQGLVVGFFNYGRTQAQQIGKLTAEQAVKASYPSIAGYAFRGVYYSASTAVKKVVANAVLSVWLTASSSLLGVVGGVVLKSTVAIAFGVMQLGYLALRAAATSSLLWVANIQQLTGAALYSGIFRIATTTMVISGLTCYAYGAITKQDKYKRVGLGFAILGLTLRLAFTFSVRMKNRLSEIHNLAKAGKLARLEAYAALANEVVNASMAASLTAISLDVSRQLMSNQNISMNQVNRLAMQIFVVGLLTKAAPLFFGNPFMASASLPSGAWQVVYRLSSTASWLGAGMMAVSRHDRDSDMWKWGQRLLVMGFMGRMLVGNALVRTTAWEDAKKINLMFKDLGLQAGVKATSQVLMYREMAMRGVSAAEFFWNQAAHSVLWFRMFPIMQAGMGIDHFFDAILGIFDEDIAKDGLLTKVDGTKLGYLDLLRSKIRAEFNFSTTGGGLLDIDRIMHDVILGQMLHVFGVTYSARSGVLGELSTTGGLLKGLMRSADSQAYANFFNTTFKEGFARRVFDFVDNMLMFNLAMAPMQAFSQAMKKGEPAAEEQPGYLDRILQLPNMITGFLSFPVSLATTLSGDRADIAAFASEVEAYILLLIPQGRGNYVLDALLRVAEAEFKATTIANMKQADTLYFQAQELFAQSSRAPGGVDVTVLERALSLLQEAIKLTPAKENRLTEMQKLEKAINTAGKAAKKGIWADGKDRPAAQASQESSHSVMMRILSEKVLNNTDAISSELAVELMSLGQFDRAAMHTVEQAKYIESLRSLSVEALMERAKGFSKQERQDLAMALTMEALKRVDATLRTDTTLSPENRTKLESQHNDILKSYLEYDSKYAAQKESGVLKQRASTLVDLLLDAEMGLLSFVGREDALAPKDANTVLKLIRDGSLSESYRANIVSELASRALNHYIATELYNARGADQGAALSRLLMHSAKLEGSSVRSASEELKLNQAALPESLRALVLDGSLFSGIALYLSTFATTLAVEAAIQSGEVTVEGGLTYLTLKTAIGDILIDGTVLDWLAQSTGLYQNFKSRAGKIFRDEILTQLEKSKETASIAEKLRAGGENSFEENFSKLTYQEKDTYRLAAQDAVLKLMAEGAGSIFRGALFCKSLAEFISQSAVEAGLDLANGLKAGAFKWLSAEFLISLQEGLVSQRQRLTLKIERAKVRFAAATDLEQQTGIARSIEKLQGQLEVVKAKLAEAVMIASKLNNAAALLIDAKTGEAVLLFGERVTSMDMIANPDAVVMAQISKLAMKSGSEDYMKMVGKVLDVASTPKDVSVAAVQKAMDAYGRSLKPEDLKALETLLKTITPEEVQMLKMLLGLNAGVSLENQNAFKVLVEAMVWNRLSRGLGLEFNAQNIESFRADLESLLNIVREYKTHKNGDVAGLKGTLRLGREDVKMSEYMRDKTLAVLRASSNPAHQEIVTELDRVLKILYPDEGIGKGNAHEALLQWSDYITQWENRVKAGEANPFSTSVAFALFDMFLFEARRLIAQKDPGLYFKLYSFSSKGYSFLRPGLTLTKAEKEAHWDSLLIADGMRKVRTYQINGAQIRSHLEFYDKNINAPMGVGKSLVAYAFAAINDVSLILVPNLQLYEQMIRGEDGEPDVKFFEAISGKKVVMNSRELFQKASEGNLEALRELCDALKSKNRLVVIDRETAAQLQNSLQGKSVLAYKEYLEAYAQSAKLFDEVHQCVDPMHFIVGGEVRFAGAPVSQGGLENFPALNAIAQELGKVLFLEDREDNFRYKDREGNEGEFKKGTKADFDKDRQIFVTRDIATFRRMSQETGVAVIYVDAQMHVVNWTSPARINEILLRALSPEIRNSLGAIEPFSSGEILQLFKAAAVDFRDPGAVETHILGRGGVQRVDRNYRPVSMDGQVQENQIISDTAWLISIKYSIDRTLDYLRSSAEALRKAGGAANITKAEGFEQAMERISKLGFVENAARIEMTRTVTAVSMLDLFVTAEGVARPRGMSGTILAVQNPLEVLSGRKTYAVRVDGETLSFVVEMLSQKHQMIADGKPPHHSFLLRQDFGSDAGRAKRVLELILGVGENIHFRTGEWGTLVGIRADSDIYALRMALTQEVQKANEGLGADQQLTVMRHKDGEAAWQNVPKDQRSRTVVVFEIDSAADVNLTKKAFVNATKQGYKAVLFANQRGLTGVNYQLRSNVVLFDTSLPEMQQMQSLWRVGRTITTGGGRWESHAEVYLDMAYVDAVLKPLQFNSEMRNAFAQYFQKRLDDPNLAQGLEWTHKDGKVFDSPGRAETDGWKKQTIAALVRDLGDPAKVANMTLEQKWLLVTALNTARSVHEAASSQLQQLLTFRLMVDPVKAAFIEAGSSGTAQDRALLDQFAQHLHRYEKGTVGLEAGDQFSGGEGFVRGVLFERSARAVNEFSQFLLGDGAKLSERVQQVLIRGLQMAQEMKRQVNNFNNIDPKNAEFADSFQGTLPTESKARAQALIAIARRYEVDILPSNTRSSELYETAAKRLSGQVAVTLSHDATAELVKGNAVLAKLMQPFAQERIEVSMENGEVIFKTHGQKLDMTSVFGPGSGLEHLKIFPYLSMTVSADGSTTLAPDFEYMLQRGPDKLLAEHLPRFDPTVLQTSADGAGVAALSKTLYRLFATSDGAQELQRVLNVQLLVDELGLSMDVFGPVGSGAKDMRILQDLMDPAGRGYVAFQKAYFNAKSYKERYDVLIAHAKGLSWKAANALAQKELHQVEVLRALPEFSKVRKEIAQWIQKLGIRVSNSQELEQVDLIHVWTALRGFDRKIAEGKATAEGLRQVLGLAILASREVSLKTRQELAATSLFNMPEAETAAIDALAGDQKDVLAIVAARALASQDVLKMRSNLELTRKFIHLAGVQPTATPIALSAVMQLVTQHGATETELTQVLDLCRAVDADSSLSIGKLDHLLRMVRKNVTDPADLSAKLTQWRGWGFDLRRSEDVVAFLELMGKQVPTTKAGIEKILQDRFVTQQGSDLLLRDPFGVGKILLEGVTAPTMNFAYQGGAWRIAIKTATESHQVDLSASTVEHSVMENDREVFRYFRRGKEVTLVGLSGPEGKGVKLNLLRPTDLVRLKERMVNGGRAYEIASGATEIDGGKIELLFNAAGRLNAVLGRNILQSGDFNPASYLWLPGTQGRIANLPPDVSFEEYDPSGDVRVRLGSQPGAGTFTVSVTGDKAGQITGGDIKSLEMLQRLASFEQMPGVTTETERQNVILRRATPYQLSVLQQVFWLLSSNEEREDFVGWWEDERNSIDDAHMMVKARQYLIDNYGKAKLSGPMAALFSKLGTQFRKDQEARKQLASKGMQTSIDTITDKVAFRAAVQALVDSDEALAVTGELLKRLPPDVREAVLRDSPWMILDRFLEKDPAYRSTYQAWIQSLSSKDSVTVKDFLDFLQGGSIPLGKLDFRAKRARDAAILALQKHQKASEIFKEKEAEILAVPGVNPSVVKDLLKHAEDWDIFAFQRLRYIADNNPLAKAFEAVKRATDEKAAEKAAEEAARLLALQLGAVKSAGRGVEKSDLDPFRRELTQLILNGYKKAHGDVTVTDYVELNFAPGSTMANLAVVKDRVLALLTGNALEDAVRLLPDVQKPAYEALLQTGRKEDREIAAQRLANAEWRRENGFRDHPIPSMVFRGDASRKLGRYWKFIGNDWASRSGAETFIGHEFENKKGSAEEIFARTGFLAIDERWLEQSYFHEELHLLYPRPMIHHPDSDAMVEEVKNYIAQMISRTIDDERARTYDIQTLYEKLDSYAKDHGFDTETMRLALDAILYLRSYLDMPTIMNILRSSENITDLLGWHKLSPEEIESKFSKEGLQALRDVADQNVAAVVSRIQAAPDQAAAVKALHRQAYQILDGGSFIEFMKQCYLALSKNATPEMIRAPFAPLQEQMDLLNQGNTEAELAALDAKMQRRNGALSEIYKINLQLEQLRQLLAKARLGFKVKGLQNQINALLKEKRGWEQVLRGTPELKEPEKVRLQQYKMVEEFAARTLQGFAWAANLEGPEYDAVHEFVMQNMVYQRGATPVKLRELIGHPDQYLDRKKGVFFAKVDDGDITLADEINKHAESHKEFGLFRAQGTRFPGLYTGIGARFTGAETLGEALGFQEHNHPAHGDGKVSVLPSLLDGNADSIFQSERNQILHRHGVTGYQRLAADETFQSGVQKGQTMMRVNGGKWVPVRKNGKTRLSVERQFFEAQQEIEKIVEAGNQVELEVWFSEKQSGHPEVLRAFINIMPWAKIKGLPFEQQKEYVPLLSRDAPVPKTAEEIALDRIARPKPKTRKIGGEESGLLGRSENRIQRILKAAAHFVWAHQIAPMNMQEEISFLSGGAPTAQPKLAGALATPAAETTSVTPMSEAEAVTPVAEVSPVTPKAEETATPQAGGLLGDSYARAVAMFPEVAPQFRLPASRVPYQWAITPKEKSILGDKLAYFDEGRNVIVLNEAKFMALPEAQAREDLAVAMVHELVHAASGDEVAAYAATAAAMTKMDVEAVKAGRAARYAWQVEVINLLIALSREKNVTETRIPTDVIQLADQILIGRGQPAEALNILLNRLQSQVYVIGEDAGSLAPLGGKVLSVRDLAGKVSKLGKFTNKATSREHTVFVASETDAMSPALAPLVQRLKELDYPVFIFDKAAIRTIFGDKVDVHAAIFQLVTLAAVLGKTEFVRLMQDYGIKPLRNGFYSVAACLVGAIKTLIGELASKQQVAIAA